MGANHLQLGLWSYRPKYRQFRDFFQFPTIPLSFWHQSLFTAINILNCTNFFEKFFLKIKTATWRDWNLKINLMHSSRNVTSVADPSGHALQGLCFQPKYGIMSPDPEHGLTLLIVKILQVRWFYNLLPPPSTCRKVTAWESFTLLQKRLVGPGVRISALWHRQAIAWPSGSEKWLGVTAKCQQDINKVPMGNSEVTRR